MDGGMMLFFAGILIVGALLFAVITLTKKGPKVLDVDKYRQKWLTIEQRLARDDVNGCMMAILDADKLLDQALREHGLKGETMGERLKNAKTIWTNANAVWSAHKLRNQIAHETEVKVGFDNARRALAGFKQALKDVGAI